MWNNIRIKEIAGNNWIIKIEHIYLTRENFIMYLNFCKDLLKIENQMIVMSMLLFKLQTDDD